MWVNQFCTYVQVKQYQRRIYYIISCDKFIDDFEYAA